WPVTGAVITLEPGRTLDHVLPAHDRAFLAVLAGRAAIGARAVQQGQTAWSDPVGGAQPSAITLQARDGDQPAVVLAFSGQPIGQPVVMGGPFVMNSKAEIYQAFQDYRSGKFGPVPRQARLHYRWPCAPHHRHPPPPCGATTPPGASDDPDRHHHRQHRSNRNGEQVARWVHDIAAQRDDADFELVDCATIRCLTSTNPCRRPRATRPPEATQ